MRVRWRKTEKRDMVLTGTKRAGNVVGPTGNSDETGKTI